MKEPRWLGEAAVKAIHEELIGEHGGLGGLRDEGLLQSALARPRNVLAHRKSSIAELAAALAHGIARNHPFVDGNKRVSFMAAYVFLALNGRELDVPETDAVAIFVDLAAGRLSEADLAIWLDKNSRKS